MLLKTVRYYHIVAYLNQKICFIYEILSALDLTQIVHDEIMHRNALGVQFEISRIPFTGVVTRLGWIYRAENVFGSLFSMKLILYNASGC